MNRRLLLYLLPSLLRVVIGLGVTVPLTTRYLNAADFGLAGLLVSLTAFLAPFASSGSAWVVGAFFFEVDEQERKSLILSCAVIELALRLSLAILAAVFVSFYLPILIQPFDREYYFFFALTLWAFVGNALWPLMSSLLIIEMRAVQFAMIELSQIILNIVTVFFVIFFLETKQLTLYLPAVVSANLTLIVTFILLRNRVQMPIKAIWLKKCIKIGFPSIPGNAVEVFSKNVDRFFVQYFAGLSQVGYYAHSWSYGSAFRILSKTFARLMRPYLLMAFSNDESLIPLQRIVSIWLWMLGFLGLAVGFIIDPVIEWITNGKLTQAAPLVMFWYVTIIFEFFGYSYTQFLITNKKTITIMWIHISANLLTIMFVFVGGWTHGVTGVATGVLGGILVNQSVRYYFALQHGCRMHLLKTSIFAACVVACGYFVVNIFLPVLFFRLIMTAVVGVLILLLWWKVLMPQVNIVSAGHVTE